MASRLLSPLIFICALAGSAAGQEMIGIDFGNGNLYLIDSHDAQTALVGNIGPGLWLAMARNSQDRYFVAKSVIPNPCDLYEINTTTWQASFVVQTDLNGIRGLAFGPGDVLYAVHDTTVPIGGGPDDLYTINLSTGASTRIGATGFRALSALAYGQGTLWSWDFFSDGLVEIDPVTGIATDVNPFVDDRDFGLCQTLCFSDSGVLYGGYSTLAAIDTITGVPSHIAALHPVFGATVDGLEFLPDQPAPFALWVQGQAGGPMSVQVSGAAPGARVALFGALGGRGPSPIPGGYPCAGTLLDLRFSYLFLGLQTADAQGAAVFGPAQVPAGAQHLAQLQALDLTTCSTTNRIVVHY